LGSLGEEKKCVLVVIRKGLAAGGAKAPCKKQKAQLVAAPSLNFSLTSILAIRGKFPANLTRLSTRGYEISLLTRFRPAVLLVTSPIRPSCPFNYPF
jgi:hypothetical protein